MVASTTEISEHKHNVERLHRYIGKVLDFNLDHSGIDKDGYLLQKNLSFKAYQRSFETNLKTNYPSKPINLVKGNQNYKRRQLLLWSTMSDLYIVHIKKNIQTYLQSCA